MSLEMVNGYLQLADIKPHSEECIFRGLNSLKKEMQSNMFLDLRREIEL